MKKQLAALLVAVLMLSACGVATTGTLTEESPPESIHAPEDARPLEGVPQDAEFLYSNYFEQSSAYLGYGTTLDLDSKGTVYIYSDVTGSIDLSFSNVVSSPFSVEKADSGPNLYAFSADAGTYTFSMAFQDIDGAIYVYFLPEDAASSTQSKALAK